MSETESHTGKLIPVESKGSLEDTAKYILETQYGVHEIDEWCDSFIEQLRETAYKEYFVIGETIYKGELRDLGYDNIAEASLNPDGTINVTVQFYNGGCSLGEAITDAVKKIKSSNSRIVSECGVGDWCHPGDDPDQRWIIMFEDQDVPRAIYYDEQEAYDVFKRAEKGGWNCHLFTSVPRNLEQK